MKKLTSFILAFSTLSAVGWAQITVTGSYSQDFESLDWDASESTSSALPSGLSLSSANSGTISSYRANWNGTETSNNLASTEVKSLQILTTGTQSSGDRVWDDDTRLGARTGGILGNFFATFHLENGSGMDWSGFGVSYEAAQFYARESGAIGVQYSFDNSAWSDISGLTYDAPVVSPGESRAVTETELLDSITTLTGSVSGISIASGDSVYLRFAFWRDIPGGSVGNSPVLAINDVEFIPNPTAVPEPSTYALLGGLAALALVVYRRRRRR